MIITPTELIDILLMTAIVGYIFMDHFKAYLAKPVEVVYPLRRFDWESFKLACMITAPAIILHELSHKFAALYFGLSATFHAAYSWLFLGVILKLLGGFIFFVPGYVSISSSTGLQSAITASAGPLMNLMLFLASTLILTYKKQLKHTTFVVLTLTKKINLFLFVFNMIPISGFDGATVIGGLIPYII